MSKFFESETVRREMEDITDLQKELYTVIMKFPYMSDEAKWEHMQSVKELLDKQQVMWTRLSLSDDPEAQAMKKKIQSSSKDIGFGDADMQTIFKNMKYTIDQMQKHMRR